MIYANIGRRKTGKTTLARYLATRVEVDGPAFYFDPRGMIRPPGALILNAPRSGDVIRQGMGEVIDTDTEEGEEDNEPPIMEFVVTPGPGNQARDFGVMCQELYRWVLADPSAKFVLIVDEIRFVKSELSDPVFDWLLRCADPDNVHIILTCHRPTDVPVDMRAIFNHWLVFRTVQEHDLKILRERDERFADAVRQLGPRQFADWNDDEATMALYKDPSAWFRPLRAGVPALHDHKSSTLGLEPAVVPVAQPKLL